MYKVSNDKIVEKIIKFLVKNELTLDVSIYSDNKRYTVDSEGKINAVDNVKASAISEYMYDRFICMAFEGKFNHILNYPSCAYDYKIIKQFDEMLEKMGCYSELGETWNLKIISL